MFHYSKESTLSIVIYLSLKKHQRNQKLSKHLPATWGLRQPKSAGLLVAFHKVPRTTRAPCDSPRRERSLRRLRGMKSVTFVQCSKNISWEHPYFGKEVKIVFWEKLRCTFISGTINWRNHSNETNIKCQVTLSRVIPGIPNNGTPLMVGFLYYSHIFRDSGLRVGWE